MKKKVCDNLNARVLQIIITNLKMKEVLLQRTPLWRDILVLRSIGVSCEAIARACGCRPSTIMRHLKSMKAAGMFDDPLEGIEVES